MNTKERKTESIVSIPFIKKCLKEAIYKMNNREKIKKVFLFGSYSKGTCTPNSDVDLFVDVEEGFSLFDLGDLQIELEKSLGKKVDIATNSHNEYFFKHIQKEKIQLYERTID